MAPENEFIINERSYGWYVRSLQILESRLGLNIKIHHDEDWLSKGQIFLFNHFARFETLVPPYIIYRTTGAYCRSIADHTLFSISEGFSKFLRGGGAVPDNLPGLLPFLAAEILRGRKIVIFPEGGMVKDRRVLDDRGRFRVFSRTSFMFRKHHQGAAVLALTLDLFKRRIKDLLKAGDHGRIDHWCEALGIDRDDLLVQVERPTLIIPATITFNPIRVSDNILSRGIELFSDGLSDATIEELAVEGNLLLRETDMDIRLGEAISARSKWCWWSRLLLRRYFLTINSLNELFGLKEKARGWSEHLLAHFISRDCKRIRDLYMERLYSGVTVNLSHLASDLISTWVDMGRRSVQAAEFHRALYLALKRLQNESQVHLHRGLEISESYQGLLNDDNTELQRFMETCQRADLLSLREGVYHFHDKLQQDYGPDEVRLENPVLVYRNEVAPIKVVHRVVLEAIDRAGDGAERELVKCLFDDELRSFAWNQERFSKKQFQEINKKETATNSGEPYLMRADNSRVGVLLVHGFMASPAELYNFAEALNKQGYVSFGVRLAGHGTSPWDLQGRSWQEWLASVRRGHHLLSLHCDQIVVVGFSAGGALALMLAAERPPKLAGVASVATPLSVKGHKFAMVPVVYFLNKLARHIPGVEHRPFYQTQSEHPETNYHSVPLAALNEFKSLMRALKPVLAEVSIPAMVLQGDQDKVIATESGQSIFDNLASREKSLHWIPSKRHGLIAENIGETWALLERFICQTIALGRPGTNPPPRFDPSPVNPVPALAFYPVQKPVHSLFEQAAERFPLRPCLNFLGRTYLYQEVHLLINRVAAGLQSVGVKKGDRVGLCLPNSPFFVISYYAALKIGAVVVNFNPLYTAEEVTAQVKDSGVVLMITLDLKVLYQKVASALGRGRLNKIVFCSFAEALPPLKQAMFRVIKLRQIIAPPSDQRNIPFNTLLSHGHEPVPVDITPDKDIALLQYTGGTTGQPKGAMLTHSNVASNTEQVRRWMGAVEPAGERFLAVLPFFHVFAMTAVMNLGLATGSELILLPRFEIKNLLKTIERTRPTIFPGVPTIFAAINNFSGVEGCDLSSVRYCISGGAALPTKVKSRFEELAGCVLAEGYGLSETSPVLTCNPLAESGKAGAIGLPLPGTEIEVRDLEMPERVLQNGEQGELYVRGPQVMAGYWKRPKENQGAFSGEWFKSGDLGYMDDDGYLFLTGRCKEIIISSGYNVYPQRIEKALYAHPEVEEAVVIGVPDEYRGEVAKAFVQLKRGAKVTEKELLAFTADQLNPIEHLTALEFRRHLPKTLIGKLSKKELIQEEALKRAA